MIKFNFVKLYFSLTAFLLPGNSLTAQTNIIEFPSTVRVVGAMKNVMWKGELFGTIDLDTIANKQHLYGLGPVEYLAGEILIVDGQSYQSLVLSGTTMKVEETFKVKAPFFVCATVENWKERSLPDSIESIKQLEDYLDLVTTTTIRPFAFKLNGTVETAKIHIVNLPKGTRVNSPDDAHRGKTIFTLDNELSTIVGFFSTKHQAIFTHHDTYLHMHLITKDKTKMGHLDEVKFKKGTMKLYLPTQ